MRALVFDGSAVKFRPNHPDPAPAAGEALIKVRLAGLCQTDLEIAKGYMAFRGILGHEFVGTVAKLAPATDPKWLNQRVCAEINCPCGKCDMCHRGLSTHCFHRTVIGILNRDGAFADLITIPARNLHLIPDHVSDEQAVFVEPLAAAFQILRQVPIEKRTRVTILGDGRLGLLIAQVLQRTACQLTLVGHHEDKLAIAERLAARTSSGAAASPLRTCLDSQLSARRDQDLVIDATGKASGFRRALELVRPRGTVVLKTTIAGDNPLNLAPIVIDEITILGSRCGPFPDAINALAAHEIDPLPLISRRVPLAQSEPLFTHSPTGIKTLLTFGA